MIFNILPDFHFLNTLSSLGMKYKRAVTNSGNTKDNFSVLFTIIGSLRRTRYHVYHLAQSRGVKFMSRLASRDR